MAPPCTLLVETEKCASQVHACMHACSLTALLKQSDCSAEAVRGILTRRDPSFWPRLPGLTKLMGRFTKDGDWRKALTIYESLPLLGLRPDTTISNAAIAACDKGGIL